jgi:Nif-specific regulatory protein
MSSHKNVGSTDARQREAQRLSTLLDVSQALAGLDLKASLHRVLEILARAVRRRARPGVAGRRRRRPAARGRRRRGDSSRAVRYRMGEGITGRAVQSGKPIVVPRVSREPAFLHRAARRPELARQELSFICVPIVLSRRAVGALAIDVKFDPERTFNRSVKFLGIVASMIAQAVKIHRLIEEDKRRLADENAHLRQELRERYEMSNMVGGGSGPMRQIYEQVAQVAASNTTVLIRGESGTGKELIAHAIHYNSLRAKKPFVKVSCAALPDSLIESELFGYEKGAFTGAEARKKGRFELAEGGTLFLDEIGDVNLATQVKLLRVLQEREFERVGGTETLKANVRWSRRPTRISKRRWPAAPSARICTTGSTSSHLRAAAARTQAGPAAARRSLPGEVRARARPADQAHLDAGDRHARQLPLARATSASSKTRSSAPVLMCDGEVIHGHHLPPSLQTAEASGTVTRVSLKDAIVAYEKDLIQDALKTTRGNRARRRACSTRRNASSITKYAATTSIRSDSAPSRTGPASLLLARER